MDKYEFDLRTEIMSKIICNVMKNNFNVILHTETEEITFSVTKKPLGGLKRKSLKNFIKEFCNIK